MRFTWIMVRETMLVIRSQQEDGTQNFKMSLKNVRVCPTVSIRQPAFQPLGRNFLNLQALTGLILQAKVASSCWPLRDVWYSLCIAGWLQFAILCLMSPLHLLS
jgi:hypothetical protein